MGRIGRTYPRHEFDQAVIVPVAARRLLFARKGLTQRFAGFFWLAAVICVVLLGWPRA